MQATFSTLFLKTSLFSSLQELLELHYYWSIHFDQFRMYLLYWLITSSLKITNIDFKKSILSPLRFHSQIVLVRNAPVKGLVTVPIVKSNRWWSSPVWPKKTITTLWREYTMYCSLQLKKIKNKKINYKEYAMLICLIY